MWKLPEKYIQVIVTYGTIFWITGCFLNNCLRGYMKAGTSSLKGVCEGIFRISLGQLYESPDQLSEGGFS
jgi:hypothetical protein